MAFDRRFDALRLNADVALGDGGAAVLQEPLDQGVFIKNVSLLQLF